MKIKIYQASKTHSNSGIFYVFIPSDKEINEIDILESDRLGRLIYYKDLEINPGEKRIALDADKAIQSINEKGYHIQGTKINFRSN